ncbi:MAG: hypothetical protein IKJ73_06075 [Lachnospiraceae bacterium]|nr:hypothetical protein [Lachnospiraceae bacterium]
MTIFSDERDELYNNEYGSCAYIVGAIRVITDNFDMALYEAGVHYEALASDVFCIDGLDESIIKKHIIERIRNLVEDKLEDNFDEKLLAEIEKLDIKPTNMSMQETIFRYYKNRLDCDNEKVKATTEKYAKGVEYYLGKPKNVYEADKDTIDVCGILSSAYLGILFNIVFVEYEKHMLMFLHGSCE